MLFKWNSPMLFMSPKFSEGANSNHLASKESSLRSSHGQIAVRQKCMFILFSTYVL